MRRSFRVCATVAILIGRADGGACGKKKPRGRCRQRRHPRQRRPRRPTKPAPPPPPPPAPAPPPAPRTPTEDEVFARMTLDELNKKGVLADVFFALDSTELDPRSRAARSQKNIDYLKRWTTTKVMVEGHADSRGTNEYNLALGERRAGAVRDYLVSLGIPADRVTVVSKGEERRSAPKRPRAAGSRTAAATSSSPRSSASSRRSRSPDRSRVSGRVADPAAYRIVARSPRRSAPRPARVGRAR